MSSEPTQIQRLSYLTIYSGIFLVSTVFFIPLFQSAYQGTENSTYVSIIGFTGLFLSCLLYSYFIKPTKEFLGLIPIQKSKIFESIILSFLFCLLAIFLKYLLLTYVSNMSSYPLFVILNPPTGLSTESILLVLILYLFYKPIQTFIFHSIIQSSFINFLDIKKYKNIVAILLPSFLFFSIHFVFSLAFVLIVSIPGLVWFYLFNKHRCFTTLMISHMIIGGILLFLVGVIPIFNFINSYLGPYSTAIIGN